MGKAAVIPVNFDLPAKRRDDEQVKSQYDPNNPNAGRGRGGFGGGGGRGGATPDPNRLTAGAGGRTDRRHAGGWRRGGPFERCGTRRRRDRRPAESRLRPREGGADFDPAQRRLRPRRTPAGRRRRRQDGVPHRQPRLSRRQDELQRGRRNSGYGQGGRDRDAGRPPGFVARRHRRNRQRHRLGDHDGSGAADSDAGLEAAADGARGAVVG